MSHLTSKAESLRYARLTSLPSMDFEGQERLLSSHLLVIGAGGLGNAALPYLAGSGVGHITVVDHDRIEVHNLPRQIMFNKHQIGEFKATAAAAFMQTQNSDIQVVSHTQKITELSNLEQLGTHFECVLDCSDNLTTRQLVNRFCFQHRIPLVTGAAIRFEGQVAVFLMNEESPCYQCLSDSVSDQQLTCMEAGVFSPTVGVIGSLIANESLKILANVGHSLKHTLLLYDGAYGEFRAIRTRRKSGCTVCG